MATESHKVTGWLIPNTTRGKFLNYVKMHFSWTSEHSRQQWGQPQRSSTGKASIVTVWWLGIELLNTYTRNIQSNLLYRQEHHHAGKS